MFYPSGGDKKRTNTLFQAGKSTITLEISIKQTQIQILCQHSMILMLSICEKNFIYGHFTLTSLAFLTNALALINHVHYNRVLDNLYLLGPRGSKELWCIYNNNRGRGIVQKGYGGYFWCRKAGFIQT